jgi:hypothetical protein
MTVATNLEECDILFCDTALTAGDGRGGEAAVRPLFCSVCGKAWVPQSAADGKPADGIRGWATRLLKAFEAGGERCPFCNGTYGFPYESPQVEGLVHEKRAEWFLDHPVRPEVPVAHSFVFRSGFEAHTLGEFLTYAPANWDVASWHFAEGHMEQWLRAVGHKEIAAIFRESRQLLGAQQAAFERCLSLLKEYGALEEDF